MPHSSAFRASSARLLIIAGILLLPVACGLWPRGIHPEFVDKFVEVNRRSDDDAYAVAFDAPSGVLAVGRESGRLELWNTRKLNDRLLLEAHSMRTQHIAFGTAEGIVLTNSEIDDDTKVWDLHGGELLHEIKGAHGPVVSSHVKGVYVVANLSGLVLYQHASRTLIGQIEINHTITALAADPSSDLIAAGTASGSLHLLKLEKSGESWKLSALREAQPYEMKNWVMALAFQNGGSRLVSAMRAGDVAEWDTATLQQQRVLPTTLRHVWWASFTPNEPWLLLAGTIEPDGLRHGKIEIVDLTKGVALRYKANTNMPVAVLLPEVSTGLILQSGSVKRIRYVDR